MNLLKNNGWKCLWRGHPAQPTDQLKPPTSAHPHLPGTPPSFAARFVHCSTALCSAPCSNLTPFPGQAFFGARDLRAKCCWGISFLAHGVLGAYWSRGPFVSGHSILAAQCFRRWLVWGTVCVGRSVVGTHCSWGTALWGQCSSGACCWGQSALWAQSFDGGSLGTQFSWGTSFPGIVVLFGRSSCHTMVLGPSVLGTQFSWGTVVFGHSALGA